MNLREYFSRYPLGCESFGAEWLRRWEALGRLLSLVARLEWRFTRGKWHRWEIATVAELLQFDHRTEMRKDEFRRIVLLDGTVIREWGPLQRRGKNG